MGEIFEAKGLLGAVHVRTEGAMHIGIERYQAVSADRLVGH
jgi:hypothetical protein